MIDNTHHFFGAGLSHMIANDYRLSRKIDPSKFIIIAAQLAFESKILVGLLG